MSFVSVVFNSFSLPREFYARPTLTVARELLGMRLVRSLEGARLSGIIIDRWFTYADQGKNWHGIWITFALYALAMAILFVPLFKHRHDAAAMRSLHTEPVIGP